MTEVAKGQQGHYFLLGSVHNILKHFKGEIQPSEASITNFSINIQNRKRYCENNNIQYKHVIYPDKLSVLKDLYTSERLRTFTSYYRPFFTNDILDLTDFITKNKPSDLFFKTDTHLNFDGKLLTTLRVVSEFQTIDFNKRQLELEGLRGDSYEFLGDLGSKLNPHVSEGRYEIINRNVKRYNNQVGANDGLVVICLNKKLLKDGVSKRLLIFGDSFCERALLFYSVFYSEIIFCRTRYFHEEIVRSFNPDDLISESAERYFSSVRLDIHAPRFELIYGLRGFDYSKNMEFYKAYNALLSFDKPAYKKFIYDFISSSD